MIILKIYGKMIMYLFDEKLKVIIETNLHMGEHLCVDIRMYILKTNYVFIISFESIKYKRLHLEHYIILMVIKFKKSSTILSVS